MVFIWYPKCSTCIKAKNWLDDQNIEYQLRDIKQQPPTAKELEKWHKESGLELKRFYNTSGQVYKQQNLKDKIPAMTEAEQYQLLASDGMLVKRPILVGEQAFLIGFKPQEWSGIMPK